MMAEVIIDDKQLGEVWHKISQQVCGVEMLLSWREAAMLHILASTIDAQGHIVEIGGWMGGSTVVLGTACQDRGVPLITVDHWVDRMVNPLYGWDTSVFFYWMENIKKAGVGRTCVPIRGESPEIAKTWTYPISLLFIDGGHFMGLPKADFDAWTPFVSIGGIVVVHDYGKPEVIAICEEIETLADIWQPVGKVDTMYLYQRRACDERSANYKA